MGGLFLRLRTWWETADRTQKVVTIFGGSFLVLLLAGTFYFGTRPKMALAWGGLTPADQGRVISEIQKLGIPVEYDLRGGVLVPSDKVAEVQATLSENGVAPTSGHLGNEGLDKIGPMSTRNVEDAKLKAIREGEIAKSIESISGVSAAKVLLSGGDTSPFAGESEPPSASVTITERSGANLGGNEAKAIASLVARSVPGLTTKNVTLVNQDGVTLFDGAFEEGQQGMYTAKLEAQINEARRVKRELQPILDNAFGAGNTLLTTRVEMDFDQATEKSITPKISKESVTTEATGEFMGEGAAGAAKSHLQPSGTAGNTGPAAPATISGPAGDKKDEYGSVQTRSDKAVGELQVEKVKAPGTITSMTISVLVDSKTIKDPKPVKDLIDGYLGPKQEGQSFLCTVTPTEFDRSAVKKATDAANASASREKMQQMMSLLPTAALVLVAFVVIRALGKAAKSSNVLIQALPDGRLVTVGGKPGSPLPVGLTRVGGSNDGSIVPHEGGGHDDDEEDIYEEIEDETGAKAWKPKKRKKGPRMEDIEDIPDQVNVPLEQIKKMGNERPGVAAMLIKSWLIQD